MSKLDKQELQEWLDSLQALIDRQGKEYAKTLLEDLGKKSSELGVIPLVETSYVNSILPEDEVDYPGEVEIENRIINTNIWNTAIMVAKANKVETLSGHISTYASISQIYEVGFNHFYKGMTDDQTGDLVYFQGHSAPGIYSRGFLEGYFTKEHMDNYRQETGNKKASLTSYPHPKCMPDYWQFPTVSMGLGPFTAIYQARFLKYLENRGLIPTDPSRKVYVYIGDGETDEPETLGAIKLASREKLDNLVFIINCNLQRLDGPVYGNGSIIRELEKCFIGAGWNTIKTIWGSKWDSLFAKDESGNLIKLLNETVDGEYQRLLSVSGAEIREQFFGKYSETKEMVAHLSDEEVVELFEDKGGHDHKKVYNSYKVASETKGRPTCIIFNTIKGYKTVQAGKNPSHSWKKPTKEDLQKLSDALALNVKDIDKMPYLDISEADRKYLLARRADLGGFVPRRKMDNNKLAINDENFTSFLAKNERENSTTMIYVRILMNLLKDKEIGKLIVPIIGDEARTFGMEGLFRQYNIYAPSGQQYTPHDKATVMYYGESSDGQILQEGISEAGSMASWIASAMSCDVVKKATIPMYITYSMFGFQRIGDLAWLAGDVDSRGFVFGATSGKTTLAGEGLQHDDGHSHVLSATYPTCRSYDPTFSYELAVIMKNGLKEMYSEGKRKFYYITLLNEDYTHPEMPKTASEEDIMKGLYLFSKNTAKQAKFKINLLSSGSIMNESIKASEILAKDYGVEVSLWGMTSATELAREASAVARENLRSDKQATHHLGKCLADSSIPVVIATDYIRTYSAQIAPYIKNDLLILGTDGYGRSDARAALRAHFEVDTNNIILNVLGMMCQKGIIKFADLKKEYDKFGVDIKKAFSLNS